LLEPALFVNFSVDDEKEIKIKKLADRRLLLKFAIQQNVAVSQPITGPEKKKTGLKFKFDRNISFRSKFRDKKARRCHFSSSAPCLRFSSASVCKASLVFPTCC